jgi:hypothetical protein
MKNRTLVLLGLLAIAHPIAAQTKPPQAPKIKKPQQRSDAAGSAPAPKAATPCLTTNQTWWTQQLPLGASISTTGVVTFDVAPDGLANDTVYGISQGPSTNYPQLAAIVRFGVPSGIIQAMSGATPTTPDQYIGNVAYTVPLAGTYYHVELDLRVAQHKYDAFVTPPGGNKTTIGLNLNFRASAGAITQLDTLGGVTGNGTSQFCNVVVPGVTAPTVTIVDSVPYTATGNLNYSIVQDISKCTAVMTAPAVITMTCPDFTGSLAYTATGTVPYQKVLTFQGLPPGCVPVLSGNTVTVSGCTSGTPSMLACTITSHSVALNWAAPAADTSNAPTGYNIYRTQTSGSNYTKIGSTTTALTYVDAAVSSGMYYYAVTAVNGAGESAQSNEVSAQVP